MTGETDADHNNVCDLLDKMTLKYLHLVEDKIQHELRIESSVNNGSIHLAKSRYIMGQNSVNFTRLPTESSPEFAASLVCEDIVEDGVKQLKVTENESENTVNPLKWFGVLVPQNLHKAKNIFQHAINHVVECVNVQLQINETEKNIDILRKYKTQLK